MGRFEEWQAEGQPAQAWPRLETINRDIKFLLLEAIEQQKRRDPAPVLWAWFPHEVRAVRQAINHALLASRPGGAETPKEDDGRITPIDVVAGYDKI